MIGREREVAELNKLYEGKRAELVAIYGRRRVGKTYLVDETFEGRITFRHAGISPEERDDASVKESQIRHFCHSLEMAGAEMTEPADNWLDAFFLLEKHLSKIDDGSRQLVFLDELPWLDTPNSRFMAAFEAFWNTWGCHRKNLMVIVCGSANSWILDNLIDNHGGLYGRVTYEIRLSAFNLHECESFFTSRNVNLSRYDIVQSYMVFGGIPYYLGYVQEGLSLAQNIDSIFFARNSRLRSEFDRMFASVFAKPEMVKNIVRFLYTRSAGYTRKEIVEQLGISDGGRLSGYLNALIASDFIVKYVPFGLGKREEHYKLVDPFCLFYLHFVYDKQNVENYWQVNSLSPSVTAWRGLAFENVCFNHIDQIKRALGVPAVVSRQSAWSKRDDDGTQTGLLIFRNDNIVNMCEIRFYSDDFKVDKACYRQLLHRQTVLSEAVPRKAAVHSTLITTFGLARNEYSSIFTNVVAMDDLFEKNWM